MWTILSFPNKIRIKPQIFVAGKDSWPTMANSFLPVPKLIDSVNKPVATILICQTLFYMLK